nr:hypothetical protein [Tanacetum cinerariifolium]
MDNPNIIMEEYARLEKEKARRRGKALNWETAKYGRICYDKDVHDLRSVENKFPAIGFNDSWTSLQQLAFFGAVNEYFTPRLSGSGLTL